MYKKLALVTALTAISVNAQASAGPFGDPSVASVHVYGMALSTNADCSNATVVGYNAAGVDYDFKKAPTLFNGSIPSGTYQCVVLYMSSNLTFTAATTVGTCTAGVSVTRNVNSGGSSTFTTATPNAANVLVYGAATAASGTNSQDITHPDKVLLFLSTGSTGTGQTGGAFLQPTTATPTNGIKLGAPFVVSDSGASGTFVVNFTGKLDGGATPCDLGPPTFTFR